jgi:DNA-binding MarR family transcriptional regulator
MKIKKYLEQSPIFALNTVYENVIPKINKTLKAEQLNLLQGLVLTSLLFESEKDVNPSHLAEVFQTSRGNMSHIISDLEYRGYVKRVVNPKDARGFKIELKAEGKKKALSLIKFFDRLQDVFEKKMGAQNCQKAVNGLFEISKVYLSFDHVEA